MPIPKDLQHDDVRHGDPTDVRHRNIMMCVIADPRKKNDFSPAFFLAVGVRVEGGIVFSMC